MRFFSDHSRTAVSVSTPRIPSFPRQRESKLSMRLNAGLDQAETRGGDMSATIFLKLTTDPRGFRPVAIQSYEARKKVLDSLPCEQYSVLDEDIMVIVPKSPEFLYGLYRIARKHYRKGVLH